jgi:hypothetical protein
MKMRPLLNRFQTFLRTFRDVATFRQRDLMASVTLKPKTFSGERSLGEIHCSIQCELDQTYVLIRLERGNRSLWKKAYARQLRLAGYLDRGQVGDELSFVRWLHDQAAVVKELVILQELNDDKEPLALQHRAVTLQKRRSRQRTIQEWTSLLVSTSNAMIPWDMSTLSFASHGHLVDDKNISFHVQASATADLGERASFLLFVRIFVNPATATSAIVDTIKTLMKSDYKSSQGSSIYSGMRKFRNALSCAREATRVFNMLTGNSDPSHFAEQNLGGDGRRSLAGGERAVVKASRTGVGTKARSKRKS